MTEGEEKHFKEMFRKDVVRTCFKYCKYVDPNESWLSKHGPFIFKAYAMVMMGNKVERIQPVREKWDRYVAEVPLAIRNKRNSAIKALQKSYVGK